MIRIGDIMNKREQLIKLLTEEYTKYDGEFRVNAFTTYPSYKKIYFYEVKEIADSDLDKVIELYDNRSNGNWQMNNRLLLLECLYSVIKDNSNYSSICFKLMDIYKIELDNSLMVEKEIYDDFKFVKTGEIERKSYINKMNESTILVDMCLNSMKYAQLNSDANKRASLQQLKNAIYIYDSIDREFKKAGKQLSPQINAYINLVRPEIDRLAEAVKIEDAQERQKKEDELITLQQEINQMENEKLEIEKRLKQISSETLGNYYSKRISERYPEEYQMYQQHKEQLKNSSNNSLQIIDLKKRFNKISNDLQLYKAALPVYEQYYNRYHQIKNEKHNERNAEKEQARIYNLIHSEENERLKRSRIWSPTRTAWHMSDKKIPEEYKGMTYEQVENLINQGKVQDKKNNNIISEENSKEQLMHQIWWYCISDSYEKTQVMPENVRNELETKTIEQLQKIKSKIEKQLIAENNQQYIQNNPFNNVVVNTDSIEFSDGLYIKDVKKENANSNVNNSNNIVIKNSSDKIKSQQSTIDLQSIVKQINELNPNINAIVTNGTFEYNGKYMVKARDNFGRNTSIEISKELYDKLNEYFKQNPREITTIIHNQNKRNQQSNDSNINSNEIEKESAEKKDQIINQLIKLMLDAGEFSNSGLDIGAKLQDMQYIKNKLQAMDMETLKSMILDYSNASRGLEEQNVEENSKHR